MSAQYPERSIGADGRTMVGLRLVDALYTVGGMALEFVLEPETWPVFFAWLCRDTPEFANRNPESVRSDVQAVLEALPARESGNPRRRS